MIALNSVTVYCGSADGLDKIYIAAALQMGAALASRGITLIYGGGKTGLMGAVADGALAAGGKVVGVIPESMNTPALAQTGLTRLEVTPDIQTRFARMVDLADAFIA
ncbi:MAG TPA: LOG family protein, partial [Anaerolineaceae bacterium]